MPLSVLTWSEVKSIYDDRVAVHRKLLNLHRAGVSKTFAELALGISDPTGNYSAAEHNLGPQIMRENGRAQNRVHALAGDLKDVQRGTDAPPIIYGAGLSKLKIGVGSELSCMMNPEVCWVANTRTIWTHLVFKHRGNIKRANEELALYRNEDETSEMAYNKWRAIHRELAGSLPNIAADGARKAKAARVRAGAIVYIWADAICTSLYSHHNE